jgi:hypothetical protein
VISLDIQEVDGVAFKGKSLELITNESRKNQMALEILADWPTICPPDTYSCVPGNHRTENECKECRINWARKQAEFLMKSGQVK